MNEKIYIPIASGKREKIKGKILKTKQIVPI